MSARSSTLTVGQLAKRVGLSRSTLLYYDSIGLLRPSGGRRGDGDYRCYSSADAARLELICSYRAAGLALKEIKRLLDAPGKDGTLRSVLSRRLEEINSEIRRLTTQQRLIVELLQNAALLDQVDVMSKQAWISLLEAAGFSADDMNGWHAEFERTAPEKHQQFLQFLGIPAAEIRRIRKSAREAEQ